MIDPWNPTQEEIKEWAYDKNAVCEQDWELAVYDFENIDLILELVNDKKCPKRRFFLGCLYVFSGDIVRRGRNLEIDKLRIIIEKASKYTEAWIVNWTKRTSILLSDPSNYSYEYWGLGSKYVIEESRKIDR